MSSLLNQLKADKVKLSRTSFFWLHLIIPVVGIVIFVSYMGMTPYRAQVLTGGYFQVLGTIYPIIIALLTSIISEQEAEACYSFFMLANTSRRNTLFSKLFYLLFTGLVSCLLIAFGYGFLAPMARAGYNPSLVLLVKAVLTLWGTSIFQYLLHTWLSFRFGRGANFGMAAFEFLLSALMLTGLGDTMWMFFPCAWSSRMMSIILNASIEGAILSFLPQELIYTIVVVLTLLMLAFLLFWFLRWEGQESEE